MKNKPRNPWIAGVLTLLTIGLGHMYSGRIQKGIRLYLGLYILLPVCMIFLFLYPSLAVILVSLAVGFAYVVYAITDSVQTAKRGRSFYQLKNYNRWYFYIAVLLAGTFVIQPVLSNFVKKQIIQAYKIPAGSLKPALLIGDQILAKTGFAIKNGVQKGDVIIFSHPRDPSKDFIKRVVAVGGETVEIKEKEIYINHEKINEPYVIHSDSRIIPANLSPRDNMPAVKVPDDSLFVMGDNRDNSHDSRFWGLLKHPLSRGRRLSYIGHGIGEISKFAGTGLANLSINLIVAKSVKVPASRHQVCRCSTLPQNLGNEEDGIFTFFPEGKNFYATLRFIYRLQKKIETFFHSPDEYSRYRSVFFGFLIFLGG